LMMNNFLIRKDIFYITTENLSLEEKLNNFFST
jgi:hypothetical protein